MTRGLFKPLRLAGGYEQGDFGHGRCRVAVGGWADGGHGTFLGKSLAERIGTIMIVMMMILLENGRPDGGSDDSTLSFRE